VGASTSLPDAPTSTLGAYFALGSIDHFFPHPLCPDKDPVPAGSLSCVLRCRIHSLGAKCVPDIFDDRRTDVTHLLTIWDLDVNVPNVY
jgi:hypothetical protein